MSLGRMMCGADSGPVADADDTEIAKGPADVDAAGPTGQNTSSDLVSDLEGPGDV